MSKTLRQLILFGVPIFVGVVNWFHPVHFGPTNVYHDIEPVVGWWIILHILNLFGFALLAWAAYLLIKDENGGPPLVAKVALIIFVPTYLAFDSLIGIGTGTLIQYAKTLVLEKLTVLEPAINAYWVSGTATALATIGSVSWSIAMLAIAVNYSIPKRRIALIVLGAVAGAFTGWGYSSSSFGSLPWWIGVGLIGVIGLALGWPSYSTALLILAGVLFGTTHVVPYGPLGMLCFLLVAIELEIKRSEVTVVNREAKVGTPKKLTRPSI